MFAIIYVCKRIGKWWLIFKPFEMASILRFISQSLIKAFFSPIQTISVWFDDPRVPIFPFQIKVLSSVPKKKLYSISSSLIEAFFSFVPDNQCTVLWAETNVLSQIKYFLPFFQHLVIFHPFQTISVRLFPNKFRHQSATILTSSLTISNKILSLKNWFSLSTSPASWMPALAFLNSWKENLKWPRSANAEKS